MIPQSDLQLVSWTPNEALNRAKHSIAVLCPPVYIPQIMADASGSPLRICYLAGPFDDSSIVLSIALVLYTVHLAHTVRSFTATQGIT